MNTTVKYHVTLSDPQSTALPQAAPSLIIRSHIHAGMDSPCVTKCLDLYKKDKANCDGDSKCEESVIDKLENCATPCFPPLG
jgi:hypothetical protein